MICLCGYDGHPVQILGVAGREMGDGFLPPMVDACARCGSIFHSTAAPSPAAEPIKPAPVKHKAQPAEANTDVISLVRDRLKTLDAEIEVLESKRREADTLRRMLSAAQSQ